MLLLIVGTALLLLAAFLLWVFLAHCEHQHRRWDGE